MNKPIRNYWPQITAALIFTFALGGSYVQLDAQADDVKKNTESIESSETEIKEINQKLVAIETDQKNIKDDVDEIKTDIKEILRELRKQ